MLVVSQLVTEWHTMLTSTQNYWVYGDHAGDIVQVRVGEQDTVASIVDAIGATHPSVKAPLT